jgi:GWxTD domain-containing protein
VRYYLKDESTAQKLTKYGGFSRKKSAKVIPLLAQMNITELPTGNYLLVIEALNQKGESILVHENFFYRTNKNNEILAGSFEGQQVAGTWVDLLGNLDSIYKYVDYLYPISSDNERATQEGLLKEANEIKLKQYFFSFWRGRKALAPKETWEEYHIQVLIANKLFASRLRKGYKSDRGRVWLTYGEPDLVERRDMEPNMPPYIIWQFNSISSPYTVPQNNRIFVFGEFEPSTREFQLIHSTAIGEMQSRDWRQELYFRAYGGPGTIDPGNNPNQREFGTRTNQNIIFGTSGSDR